MKSYLLYYVQNAYVKGTSFIIIQACISIIMLFHIRDFLRFIIQQINAYFSLFIIHRFSQNTHVRYCR